MSEYDLIVESLAGGAPLDDITTILSEGKFDDEHRESQHFYLMMMEQFLDDCSCYAFKGWKELKIYGRPIIEKYWIEIVFIAPDKFDYENGVKRVLGKYKENKSTVKKLANGKTVMKLRILRSILDNIEDENRRIARKEAEDQGLGPEEKDEEDQDQEDGFGEEF